MEWLPRDKDDVVKLACEPRLPCGVSVAVPRVVVPSRKVTVPAGEPPLGPALTKTEKVTAWPGVDGLALEEREVVVGVGDTSRVRAGERAPAPAAPPVAAVVERGAAVGALN